MSETVDVTPGNNSMSVEQENTIRSCTVLANAGEMCVGILSNIAGNDIATAINGAAITNELVQTLLYQRIHQRLAART